jgi:hypothetical protein
VRALRSNCSDCARAADTRTQSASSRWALLLALSAVACGGAGKATTPKPSGPAGITDVERYLPLTDNTVFAYETLSETTGERGVLMLGVKRRRPELVELSIGGKVQRLDIVPDGVRHATGGYLLKAPLSVGATWKGQFGEVRVTALDRAVDVPAGRFQNCVETVEEVRAPAQKKATTVFCPEVGMVLLQAEGTAEGEYELVRAVLRSHGPRIDLEELPRD